MIPVDKTQILYADPPTYDAWTDVDVSSYVSDDCVGVLIHVEDSWSTNNYKVGFRKKGSTVSSTLLGRLANGLSVSGDIMVGVDDDKIFQYYKEDASAFSSTLSIYIVGYFRQGEAVFFTNPVTKTLGSPAPNAFEDVSIASDTGSDTAIAAIGLCRFNSSSGLTNFGFRKNGSTDSYVQPGALYMMSNMVVAVDGSEIFEFYNSGNCDVYIYGYILTGSTFLTNGVDYSASATGESITDISATVPAGNSGAYILINCNSSSLLESSARKNSSIPLTDTNDTRLYSTWCNIDGDRKFLQTVADVSTDLYVLGYSTNQGIQERNTLHIYGSTNSGLFFSGNYLTLFISGGVSSYLPLYTVGGGSTTNNLTLYERGSIGNSGERTLFIAGGVPVSGSMTLFTKGEQSINDNHTLYTFGIIQQSGQFPLYVSGLGGFNNSATMFIRAETHSVNTISLYIANSGISDNLPLVVWGRGYTDGNPNYPSDGFSPAQHSHTIYIKGQGESQSLPLFISAESGIISNERTLFVRGAPGLNNSVNMVVPNVDSTNNTNLKLYTHGY